LGDVKGQALVHLQCNSAQDTLSLAKLGAIVTGVDISDTAIAFAHQLAQDVGLSVTFVRADVYDWLSQTASSTQRFDVAFCSYGAICWLSDLNLWAQGVAGVLRPGGQMVMVDFHPFSMVFEEDWSLKYPYFAEGCAITWPEGIGDYIAKTGPALTPSGYLEGVRSFRNPYRSHEFQWGIGEIVTALLEAGLTLTALKEFPYSNGVKLFRDMRELPGRRMIPPAGMPSLPLMYGVRAIKSH